MKNTEINEIIGNGGVLTRIIIELQGAPKEHMEKTTKLVLNKIKEDFKVLECSDQPVEELEDHEGVFSSFAEFEIIFESMSQFLGFSFDYTPTSVEVLEPNEKMLKSSEIGDFVNDAMSKLHQHSEVMRQLNFENQILKYNSSAFLRNLLTLSLAQKDLSLSNLSKATGVKEHDLEPIIKNLVEKKELKFENDKYGLVKKK